MTTHTTSSRALRQNLERVVDAERVRMTRALVVVRAVGMSVELAMTVWLGLAQGLPDWRMALPAAALYWGVAALLVVVAFWSARWVRWLGYAVPLFDMPMAAYISASALPFAAAREFQFGQAEALQCALVVLAALSLDRVVIALAGASAVACTFVLLATLNAPASEYASAVIAPVGVAAGALLLVSRLRTLVRLSRKDDLIGKYILGARLGSGGMAEVFKATYAPEGGFERQVAVKKVLPAYATDDEFVRLFRREAELGACLMHPNLVQVLDFGKHVDTYFIAMEFVDGLSLRRLKAPLPLAAATYVGAQLAAALAYMHCGAQRDGKLLALVHRDVNPPNVLVSRFGDVKLADFGVARAADGLGVTRTGAVRGKAGYMAPEQLLAQPVDHRADLFALGLTVYELLTGCRAVKGDTDVELMRITLEARFALPSVVRPGVPAELDAMVMGLLERDPAHRTADAGVFRAQLLGLQGDAAPFPQGQRLLALEVERALAEPPAPLGPATVRERLAPEAETRTAKLPP